MKEDDKRRTDSALHKEVDTQQTAPVNIIMTTEEELKGMAQKEASSQPEDSGKPRATGKPVTMKSKYAPVPVYTFYESELEQLVEKAEAEGKTELKISYEDYNGQDSITLSIEGWKELLGNTASTNKKLEEAERKVKEAEKKAQEEAKARRKAERERKKAEAQARALSKGEMQRLCNLPTSSTTNLINEVLTAGSHVDRLPEKKASNHHNTYQVLENGSARRVVLNSDKETVTIELDDIRKLEISGKTEKKFFQLALILANEQALHNGELTRDRVTFPLEKLIELGMYSSIDSARRGFNQGMRALTSLKVSGKITDSKNKKITQEAIAVLFPAIQRKNGICTIFLNNQINWNFVSKYYTLLPSAYFSLSLKASDLLLYVCYLARQNTKKIARQGFFNISLVAIQERLQLPTLESTKNPTRDILEPIEKAVEETNKAGEEDLQIELVYDKGLQGVADIMKHGFLKITPYGDFREKLTNFSESITQVTEKRRKQKEKILENAMALKMKESLSDTDPVEA